MKCIGCRKTLPAFRQLLKRNGVKRARGERSANLKSFSEFFLSFHRSNEIARVVQTIVDIGLRGGWVELQDTPLKVPKIQLTPELQELTTPPHNHPPESSLEPKNDKTP